MMFDSDDDNEYLIHSIIIQRNSECMIVNDTNFVQNDIYYAKSCKFKIGKQQYKLLFDDKCYFDDEPINELASKLAKQPVRGTAEIVCLKEKSYDDMKVNHELLKKLAKKYKCYNRMSYRSENEELCGR